VRLWHAPAKTHEPTVPASFSPIKALTAVAFSPEGSALVCGSSEGQVKKVVWQSGQARVLTRQLGREPVLRLAFTPDGQRLLAGQTHTLHFLSSSDLMDAPGASRKTPPSVAVALSPDGKMVATASGGKIGVWDLPSGKQRQLPLPGQADSLAFAPDSRH